MALAKLCAKAKYDRKIDNQIHYKWFHAFIVDHGVRPYSFIEAIRVQQQLLSWGM